MCVYIKHVVYKACSCVICRESYSHLANINWQTLFVQCSKHVLNTSQILHMKQCLTLEGSKSSLSKILKYNGGNMRVNGRKYVKELIAKEAHMSE